MGFSVLGRDGELKEQELVMARALVFKGTDARAGKSGEDPKNMEKPLVKIVMAMDMADDDGEAAVGGDRELEIHKLGEEN